MAKPLRCTTCGAALENPARPCTTCGAENPAGRPLTWVKTCPRCRHQGYGDHYFSKPQHIALLVVLGLATSGIGALIYWLMRFQHRLCPRCGLNWRHASYRAISSPDGAPGIQPGDEALAHFADPSAPAIYAPPEDRSAQGWIRIGGGALLSLMGAGWLSGGATILGMGVSGLAITTLLMLRRRSHRGRRRSSADLVGNQEIALAQGIPPPAPARHPPAGQSARGTPDRERGRGVHGSLAGRRQEAPRRNGARGQPAGVLGCDG